jgi:hypothetical protein
MVQMSSTKLERILAWCLLATLTGCGSDLAVSTSTGEGVALSIVDGDEQTGTVGEALPEPLVVEVLSEGTPTAGHEVAFSIAGDPAGARLEPDTAVTGDDGRAVAHVVLPPEIGAYQIEATLVVSDPQPPPTAVFDAAAVAGEPDTLRAASPLTQPGRRDHPVTEAPTVVVLDRFGNPVAGAPVEWEVTAGGGEVTGGTVAGTDGRATATWTLGEGVGVQKLVARVEGAHGSPVAFTAVVLF